MRTAIAEDLLQDDFSMRLARAVFAANKRASELGVDIAQSLVTISQNFDNGSCWRVNYGPRDYVNRRGGDLLVEVDAVDASVKAVLRGQ
jgi:hypothetical protein